ncbi:MAG: peptide chain release factor N(5)-glutamine methyltransferase [Candidatus Gracilibacteria bacterium]|jgi:release factor glutamine methyltransferase
MKIKDLLNKAKKDKKLLEAEVLIANVLKCSREAVLAHDDRELSPNEVQDFHLMWVRLMNGEPLAYLINRKEFYGLDFYVDKNVLVPRPETELLVDLVLEVSRKSQFLNKKSVQVVDVGTGAGSIACALVKTEPRLRVKAVDVSEGACEIARRNVREIGVDIEVLCGDLLEPVNDLRTDIIVANLPYIGTEKYNFVSKEVADHEPSVALYGGSDGLRLYERMFKQILDFEMHPAYVLGEFGFLHASGMSEMILQYFPNAKFEIKQDLAGLDRDFVIGL